MTNCLSAYFEAQDLIYNNVELATKIENILQKNCNTITMIEDVMKHFPYDTYLIICWNKINEKFALEWPTSPHEANTINENYLYGCLYITLMSSDIKEPTESPALISFLTLLQIGLLRGQDEFLKEPCCKVLKLALKKIDTRNMLEWPITTEVLYYSMIAIKSLSMEVSLINDYIHILIFHAGRQYDMVTNLSLADRNSANGVLALACLANLLLKNCDEKHFMMETMLECIENVMENNEGLSSFQINVKQSNFQQMIRQVGSNLTSYIDQLFFSIITVAKRHPKSKSLVFIVNQLPFPMFSSFVNVVVKLNNHTYSEQLQMFSFNILESPYITEDAEALASLENLYQLLIDAIVWPIQKFEMQAVVDTTKLIYAIFQLKNSFIQKILKRMSDHNHVLQDLMTYLNQYCDNAWKLEFKMMNQYYVSIYCQVLILNENAWKHPQFLQFAALFRRAAPSDLNPCLNDIKALVLSHTFHRQKEVKCILLVGLAHVANQNVPYAYQYLRMLHDVIFSDLRVDEYMSSYNLIVAKTTMNEALLKSFVNHKLISQRDIEVLTEQCKELRCWRLLSDLAMHMSIPLNRNLLHFTEYLHDKKQSMFESASMMYVIRFFSDVSDRKAITGTKPEREALMRVAVFLEGILINRSIPTSALPIALLTIRKFHNHFQTPLERMVAMYRQVEGHTCKAFVDLVKTNGAFATLQVLTRDVTHYGEMQMVFGDLPAFKCAFETHNAIETAGEFMTAVQISAEFPALGLAMVRCMTQVAIRSDDLLGTMITMLCSLLKNEQAHLKECCLDCLYDIALFRTSSYDVLIPHIFDMLATRNPLHAVSALTVYAKLFAKEHSIPNDWQTFMLVLAVCNREVAKLIEIEQLETFVEKLRPFFGTYFIHIMFYMNEICDDDEHFLLPEYRQKIIINELPIAVRLEVYNTLIKHLTVNSCTRILNYIYKNLVHTYMNINHHKCILNDILAVTYQALKPDHKPHYPELSKKHYDRTLKQISKLENYTAKKMGNNINADDAISLVINVLVKLLSNLSKEHEQLVAKLFHTLFAIIHWHFTGIFNAIIDDGMNGKFRKNILKLQNLYSMHSHIFNYIDNIIHAEFDAHPIQSSIQRI